MIKRLLYFLDKPRDTKVNAFMSSEQGIRDWIGQLPMAHGGKALRAIYQTLMETAGEDIHWEHRYLFCTMLEQTLEHLLDGLQKQYSTNTFPLTQRMFQAADLATHVHAFMLVAYKKVLEGWQAEHPDEEEEPASLLRTKIVLRPRKDTEGKCKTALLLALYHCERIVRIPRMLGIDYPTDLWLESHRLYSIAEQRGWLDEPVKVDILPSPRPPILVYKRILLTALLDMQHLARSDLDRIFADLDDWAAAADIVNGTVRPIPETCNFYVRLEEDLPPYPLRNRGSPEEECLAARCRLLKSDRIFLRLEALARPEAQDLRMRAQTLRVLSRSWWKAPTRRQRRYQSSDYVDILLGVSPVHRQLFIESGQKLDNRPEMEDIVITSTGSGIQSHYVDAYKMDDIALSDAWLMADRGEFVDTQLQAERKEEERSRIIDYRPIKSKVLDTSSSGYRLSIAQSELRQIRAGDLVGVRSGEKGAWNLGSVRWISPVQKESLTVGVQLHFPNALPLIFRVLLPGKSSDPIPGFLAVMDRLPVLLLPAIKGLGDKLIEVEYLSRRAKVRLGTDRLMASNAFIVRNFAAGAILPGQPVDPQFGLAPVAELIFATTPRKPPQRQSNEWEKQFGDVFDSF